MNYTAICWWTWQAIVAYFKNIQEKTEHKTENKLYTYTKANREGSPHALSKRDHATRMNSGKED